MVCHNQNQCYKYINVNNLSFFDDDKLLGCILIALGVNVQVYTTSNLIMSI